MTHPAPNTPDLKPSDAPWDHAHREACARKETLYEDPQSGLWVFTEYALQERGYCCHSGCRHCPYSSP
jgi:hypothetical protein